MEELHFNYFIRIIMDHDNVPILLDYIKKWTSGYYFLGLHKQNYEHIHFVYFEEIDLKDLKKRFSQTEFRKKLGLQGKANRVKISQVLETPWNIVHYILDGCINDNLPYYHNLESDTLETIKKLELPNKYNLKKRFKINEIMEENIKKITYELLHELEQIGGLEQLIYHVNVCIVADMCHKQVYTRYYQYVELLIYHLIKKINELKDETIKENDYRICCNYLNKLNSIFNKKISQLVI